MASGVDVTEGEEGLLGDDRILITEDFVERVLRDSTNVPTCVIFSPFLPFYGFILTEFP